ncbi:hypothetical protein DLM76_06515 [Leptospira yasudae]|uniref:Uncharacterized protein n=1 Tax=Leptospira yasudae TaxID=2202201 RepID=A0ABX9M9G0_9LEPT|nr:hypothetical protein [Leptospira yasudae]RHX82220.1 hypothetical protein DLM77_01810 [Leptospira yasudae]RHX94981.1 hypothetical protein DLM76_06515 [Leptospira yasudae]TGK30402.1 hypothetical protein EHQ05_05470 [Leptospira yasudae]TGM04218.1 hypothetical protein EHQ86_13265 [Leptospira yasudae]
MKFLFRDDRTGKPSDTTLRTWIVFFLAISYLTALSVLSIVSPDSLRPLHMDLIQWLILFYGTVGSLYLGKRINEDVHSKKRTLDDVLDSFQESKEMNSSSKPVSGSRQL